MPVKYSTAELCTQSSFHFYFETAFVKLFMLASNLLCNLGMIGIEISVLLP